MSAIRHLGNEKHLGPHRDLPEINGESRSRPAEAYRVGGQGRQEVTAMARFDHLAEAMGNERVLSRSEEMAAFVERAGWEHVITSYSIHYTKLYEVDVAERG